MQNKKVKFIEDFFNNSPFDHAEIIVTDRQEYLTRYGENEITQNVVKKDESILIIVYRGKKKAALEVNQLKSINELYSEIEEILKHTKENEKLVLPFNPQNEPEIFRHENAKNSKIEADFIKNELNEDISMELIAKPVITACNEGIKNKYSAGGTSGINITRLIYANTNGILKSTEMKDSFFTITVESGNGTGCAEVNGSTLEEIDTNSAIKRAFEKCKNTQELVSIEPGLYTVVLEPMCLAEIASYLSYMAFDSESYINNNSPVNGKLNEKIFSNKLTVVEDPYFKEKELTKTFSFDLEGVDKRPTYLIENGVLKSLALSRKQAKELNTLTTGSCMDPISKTVFTPNVRIQGGNSSLEEMIASTKNGVLLTTLHYVNLADPKTITITGMTRNGTFLIENGKITKGLKNMRFTVSLFDILNNIELISNDVYKLQGWGYTHVPAMKINNFHFTSKTDF